METVRRSLLKAVLWQVIGLAVMVCVGLAMTGSWALGGAMAVLNASFGLATYVLYERLWARISWGRSHG